MTLVTGDGWETVAAHRVGETVEIVQANYDRTGQFVQVKGWRNVDRLIADLKKIRKEIRS